MIDLSGAEGQARLARWLTTHIPNAVDVRIESIATPAGSGASAETVLLAASHGPKDSRTQEALVLRRQLVGSDLFLNSDLSIQYNVMLAMQAHRNEVRVPPVIGMESGSDLLGSPFLVMRQVEGRIVPQKPPYNAEGWLCALTPEKRHAIWNNAMKALAAIHKIDWRDGFSFLTKPGDARPGLDAYLDFVGEWYEWAARGRAQPVADYAMNYLRQNKPANTQTSVLWGDAIPANMLFRDDGSVSAVIDWEMAALGPGEIDLGWWMFFDDFFSEGIGLTRLPGLPSRNETIALYEAAAGRKVQSIDYFELMGMVRLSIVSLRQYDRQVSRGKIPATSQAYLNNPIALFMAKKLGLPEPVVGEEFFALMKAATQHQ